MANIVERVNKDGSISYRADVRIRRGGKVVHRETQTWKSYKLALAWASRREVELSDSGVLDRLIRGGTEKPLTVAELIERYIEEVYPMRPWGKTKTDTLRLLSGSKFGALIAKDVTAADIIDHCKNWGASPSTMNQHYIYIRGVFSVARNLLRCEVQYSEVDEAQRTMSKLGIISKSGERDRRPTVEEMTKVVEHCYNRRMKWDRFRGLRDDLIFMDKVLVFAMFSGRRQGRNMHHHSYRYRLPKTARANTQHETPNKEEGQ